MSTNEDNINELLKPSKVLRDPVHGDVWLTSLETKIIDTRAFQRLHQLRQLGLAYLVYPGATHTRFSHSIGTVHSAQELIEAINRTPLGGKCLDPYAILLTRLCALLHDLSNIPFGHTLEDEGNLFPSQWEDRPRAEYFLGHHSEVGAIIQSEVSFECLNDIVQILTAKNNSDIERLQHPFIADIIGDTFCADLLDYSSRDHYYLGMPRIVDQRLMSYVSVTPYGTDNKERVVLNVGNKHNLLNGLIDLLRLRYDLMERVVYHHTKLRASAMLIAAVYDALEAGYIPNQELWKIGDDALLDELERYGTNVSKKLVGKLRARKLHKPILNLRYPSDTVSEDHNTKKMKEAFSLYSEPDKRSSLERTLEKRHDLPRGSIIVYCPKTKHSKKSATVLISLDERICPFNQIPDVSVREELELVEDHSAQLWKMAVLIDGEVSITESKKKDLVRDCMEIFGSSSFKQSEVEER